MVLTKEIGTAYLFRGRPTAFDGLVLNGAQLMGGRLIDRAVPLERFAQKRGRS
jgi:hypothetical protein